VAALGVTGYSVALIFLMFGAPDLAMTQFLVESLTVILFVFAFYHLPHFKILTPARTRMLHAAISLMAGGLMTVLVLSAVEVDLYPPISEYFVQQSLPLAFGRNIVNVILVDFRGIDTLGEITVLAVAAVGVFALFKFRRESQR
jgi:multicomponent Na+:H+ antiporter subunit A